MKSYPLRISFCVGVYNEAAILTKNIEKIQTGLDAAVGKNNYEIIIVDNGSTDGTVKLLRKLSTSKIQTAFLQKKGLGRAYKKAILLAKYPYVVLSAIDLPFGFNDLTTAIRYWNDYDIIFGSKAHSESHISVPIKRKIFSSVYRSLLQILFHVPIKDTQGSVFLKKNAILPVLTYCNAPDAFFNGQLAIFGHKKGLTMTEVPVIMDNSIGRKSKFNLLGDGTRMFLSIMKTYRSF